MQNWINWQECDFKFQTSDEVHVWLIPVEKCEKYLDLLNDPERHRANKFRNESAKNQFIVSRASLRLLLAKYLQLKPQQIQFTLNPYGKPYLKNRELFFNVSHSYHWAIIAISPKFEIGVDIEKMRTDLQLHPLAQRFFSTNEVKEFEELEDQSIVHGFFNAWTRKEAYIKARGKGLSIPLSEFSVSLKPGSPPLLVETKHDPEAIKHWSLTALPAPKGYKAALALHALHFKIKLWFGENLFLSLD